VGVDWKGGVGDDEQSPKVLVRALLEEKIFIERQVMPIKILKNRWNLSK
jgi:hypothetical protein